MSATFDDTLSDTISRARFELGDTQFTSDTQDDALLSDEAIEAVLAWKGYAAGVAYLAEGLITRVGQEPDSVRLPSGLSVSFTSRIPVWQRLAGRLASTIAQDTDAGAANSGDTCTHATW